MRDAWRHFAAEFVGTFALVFVGSGAIMTTRISQSHVSGGAGPRLPKGPVRRLALASDRIDSLKVHALEGRPRPLLGVQTSMPVEAYAHSCVTLKPQ